MLAFSAYKNELTDHISNILKLKENNNPKILSKSYLYSDLYISLQLRNLISINELRESGSFFTGEKITLQAIQNWNDFDESKIVFDPACGTGNLLITASKKLSIKESLIDTLEDWGKCLAGCDIHEEFIEITKLRLIVHAIDRGSKPDCENVELLKNYFFNIKKESIFDNSEIIMKADNIVMNPPYKYIQLNDKNPWASGQVNAASVFFMFCILNAKIGCNITAILPDVLRSGSRYKKWRYIISEKVKPKIIPVGRFDNKTDIDVFILNGKKGNYKPNPVWIKTNKVKKTLGDLYNISIGPVVPFRDPEKGIDSPYIYPRILAAWQKINTDEITSRRKYYGRLIKPPFIVIRRTSSPTDKYRATATIIEGSKPVAVENHLVILEPKIKNKIDTIKVLKLLMDDRTNDFLNLRIRCRHLTINAIKEIPWIGKKND